MNLCDGVKKGQRGVLCVFRETGREDFSESRCGLGAGAMIGKRETGKEWLCERDAGILGRGAAKGWWEAESGGKRGRKLEM